jgi:radical SAM protein with 4Fe4S-binding SPASM domain
MNIMKEIKSISNSCCPVEVCLTGGEAWLKGYEYISRCIEIIRDRFVDAKVSIMTNLLGYNKQIKKIIKEFDIQIGTSFDPKIRVFNGSSSEFEHLWVTKYKESKNDGFNLPVAFTITQHLLRFDILSFAETLGIESIVLKPFLPFGRGSSNSGLGVSLAEASDYANRVKEIFKGNVFFAINDCKNNCFKNNYLITAEGYIGSCEIWGNASCGIYGNINNTAEEIYYSPNRLNFITRRLLLANKCFDCIQFNKCHGGCSCITGGVLPKHCIKAVVKKL